MSRPLQPVPDRIEDQAGEPVGADGGFQRPTDRWLAAADGLPALTGPAGTAERLLLLTHYGVDLGFLARWPADRLLGRDLPGTGAAGGDPLGEPTALVAGDRRPADVPAT